MGRIHVLSDQVANQIAAGEVVDRPASVVKELLENSLDAGATRLRIEVEGGGRKLIRIADDGCGMVRDDALLAFERHATSKIRLSGDLLSLRTLGFRGEALPSIASISRLQLDTRAEDDATGTHIEIAGGKVLRVDDAGVARGTTIAVRDLFFNTPARRKFLKAESTELSHVTALVTHYALAHPEKHFELHSATHALLVAPPVRKPSERIYQVFGGGLLDQLLPMAAETRLERAGLPEPPPWRREEDYQAPEPGFLRLSGYVSRPELQKLNRNSIYVFVNRRLVRDRVILHAVSEAFRNIMPATSFPVVLMFLEMPPEEVDVNVHPAKTEVRFRQSSFLHDFVRDTIRNTLVKARPAASFLGALTASPSASASLSSALPAVSPLPGPADSEPILREEAASFELRPMVPPPSTGMLAFNSAPAENPLAVDSRLTPGSLADPSGPLPGALQPDPQALPTATLTDVALAALATQPPPRHGCDAEAPATDELPQSASLDSLASLKPLGQLRESFILAVNGEGLWIIDQHVAHERVLFEKILRERQVERVQRQRLLMPMLVELLPQQMAAFADLAAELESNGFEAEPFGPRTIAVKAAPAGLEGAHLERMLVEVLEQSEREAQSENLEKARTRIAASIACHAAIKVNTPLDPQRMEWLLAELARTEHPTSCPHGRPIALRYSWKEIQRAFQRI